MTPRRFITHAATVACTLLLAAGLFAIAPAAEQQKSKVTFVTNLGGFTIELYPDKAPITVKNFLAYVEAGFFNNTIFHRVMPGFVIQGGGFGTNMDRKETRPPIKNEAENGLKNKRGTLSMARTRDINSATSQFFVNLKDNPSLDNGSQGFGYAVFAKVIEGMEVIDKIAAVPTGNHGRYGNVPKKSVIVQLARRK